MTTVPLLAPANVVHEILWAPQALRLSIQFSRKTLGDLAAEVGVSKGYLSRMQNGVRPIPERLVGPLCDATGTLLLRQHLNLQIDSAVGDEPMNQRLLRQMRAAAGET